MLSSGLISFHPKLIIIIIVTEFLEDRDDVLSSDKPLLSLESPTRTRFERQTEYRGEGGTQGVKCLSLAGDASAVCAGQAVVRRDLQLPKRLKALYGYNSC